MVIIVPVIVNRDNESINLIGDLKKEEKKKELVGEEEEEEEAGLVKVEVEVELR